MALVYVLQIPLCAVADSPSPNSVAGLNTIGCTYVATICEDHFFERQHFRYGACALDGNETHAFGPRVIHLVNLHGESFHRGQHLVLTVRKATGEDERAQQRSRRLRQTRPPPELHMPIWQGSGRGYFVESILQASQDWNRNANAMTDSVSDLFQHRLLSHMPSHGRTLLTICMNYVASAHSCTHSDEAWVRGVPQTHTAAAYGRLSPAWDKGNSRYYIVEMDSPANYMDLSKISCSTFMESEPAMALKFARAIYPDAKLAYSHTEYIVPPNLVNCGWAGIGTLGTYNPNGNPASPIPDGPFKGLWSGTTWVKGPGMATRAHELGHNSAQPRIEPQTAPAGQEWRSAVVSPKV